MTALCGRRGISMSTGGDGSALQPGDALYLSHDGVVTRWKTAALARERFAGAVPLLVTPEYVATARGILGPDAVLVVSLFVVLETHQDRARETAREPLRFLLSGAIPGYIASTARMGFTESEVPGLSDRLVDALVAWGDPAPGEAARLLAGEVGLRPSIG